MNTKVVQDKHGTSSADIVKFVIAGLLVAAGVFAYYWFQNEWNSWLRVAAVLVGLIAGAGVFMTSSLGPKLREFFYETRFELRKVVWPTRQETMRTTWIVMIVVVVISLLLGGFDLLISQLTKLLWR
ncbi:preprotein translocase subunit SecE [Lysobacteraceae bacterium NML75-0749]|nr:preprotein translocase subunit SecE [Xanthomonadaceae bacterium NML03-0222]PJK02380.1 preprotein translocase subunit SecE [Xanthomonadaceae bacterium NML75-0749]PJK02662.1 preprotein translocase subunit SecE [Xanthomonadaceae bacterium NML91-0268]PJK07398.1 preprotein translocase subunit SecE [Xanthomonadaceae bacterium NML71-0210]